MTPDTVKPAFNEVNESAGPGTDDQSGPGAGLPGNPKARGGGRAEPDEAEGYAIERVNRANGEATRFSGHPGRVSPGRRSRVAPAWKPWETFWRRSRGSILWTATRKPGALALAESGAKPLAEGSSHAYSAAGSVIVLVVALLLVLLGTFYTWRRASKRSCAVWPARGGAGDRGGTAPQGALGAGGAPVREAPPHLGWGPEPDSHQRAEFIWVDTTARWRIADAKKFLESVATEAGRSRA